MSDKNIYQRISAVMADVHYIQKDASVQNYKAVSHDNVVARVRQSLMKHGIVIVPSQLNGKLHDKGKKYDLKTQSEIIDNMRMYEAEYDVRFVNIDKPEDFASIVVHSQALDNGDKSPGKAMSYATKYAILKMFLIETGENEESRVGQAVQFTDSQKDQFDEIMKSNSDLAGLNMFVFSHSVGPDIFTALYNSFEKGHIVSGKKACDALVNAGAEKCQNIADEIKCHIKNEDPAVSEIVDELTSDEKRLIVPHLDQSDIEYLRGIK